MPRGQNDANYFIEIEFIENLLSCVSIRVNFEPYKKQEINWLPFIHIYMTCVYENV